MTTFIHTADWQLGKPFSRVADEGSRVRLRQERIAAVRRIGDLARERQAAFVVVAGDVFDSNHATNRTISDACDAIASIGVPVHVIPGNHDHAGPGSVWEQDFFVAESRERAPNLRVHLAARPVAESGCILLPCPLHRRQAASDPCGWLRDLDWTAFGAAPRILVAHGSTRDFSGERDEEDLPGQPNFIHLEHLPLADLDYVALGDWHGLVQAGDKAWYSGSHETDRFPKTGQTTGHVAVVRVGRGVRPAVEAVPTGRTRWLVHEETFSGDKGPALLHDFLNRVTQEPGRGQVLLKLKLSGSVSLAAHAELEAMLRSWDAGLLDLRLDRAVTIEPSQEELDALVASPEGPLIGHVAGELVALRDRGGDEAAVARTALGLLHELTRPGGDR
jgi:DNA repair exonuclease SbcCD nuclease subunit